MQTAYFQTGTASSRRPAFARPTGHRNPVRRRSHPSDGQWFSVRRVTERRPTAKSRGRRPAESRPTAYKYTVDGLLVRSTAYKYAVDGLFCPVRRPTHTPSTACLPVRRPTNTPSDASRLVRHQDVRTSAAARVWREACQLCSGGGGAAGAAQPPQPARPVCHCSLFGTANLGATTRVCTGTAFSLLLLALAWPASLRARAAVPPPMTIR